MDLVCKKYIDLLLFEKQKYYHLLNNFHRILNLVKEDNQSSLEQKFV